MFGLNYQGMKKTETYEEVIDYIQNRQEKIRYPNRAAKRARESHQFTNLLDGDGNGFYDPEQWKRNMAYNSGMDDMRRDAAAHRRSLSTVVLDEPVPPPSFISFSDDGYRTIISDSDSSDSSDDPDDGTTLRNEKGQWFKRINKKWVPVAEPGSGSGSGSSGSSSGGSSRTIDYGPTVEQYKIFSETVSEVEEEAEDRDKAKRERGQGLVRERVMQINDQIKYHMKVKNNFQDAMEPDPDDMTNLDRERFLVQTSIDGTMSDEIRQRLKLIQRKKRRGRWVPGGTYHPGMYPNAEYEKDIHELYLEQRHALRHPLIGKLKIADTYAPGHVYQEMYKPRPARLFVSSRTAEGVEALRQMQRRAKAKRITAATPAQVETYAPGQAASSTAVPALPIQQYPPTYGWHKPNDPPLKFMGKNNNKTKQI